MEPFLGGAAVFFRLQPQAAYLSDLNGELINAYELVRDQPSQVVRELKKLNVNRSTYSQLREEPQGSRLYRAARFLYLNRTAFSGIWRVNRQGRFNVPFGGDGRTTEMLWRHDLLRHSSRALMIAELAVRDFEPVLDEARRGDVVYCDPSYTVLHETNGARYTELAFGWQDQVRLAEAAKRAAKRGVAVFVTNSYRKRVRDLYRGSVFHVLTRGSRVSRDPSFRRNVREYLIDVR